MLHIGGARTALFNMLFARRHGGRYLLRIEDTDKARSTQEATQAILEGLEWLGLSPDAPPVFQSANIARHKAVAEEMLASGSAFKCYATPEELQARRDEGEQKRAASKDETLSVDDRDRLKMEANALLAPFRSPWREGAPPPAPNAPFTVRLKAPDTGKIEIQDAVQGDISVQAEEIDDLILLRADGTPTYMLAVVVDDHDMGVTHIIRGDDHLRNAIRQACIYDGLGWERPVFAHVSLIHGPDGAKLSKRHGSLGADAYRAMGYLPEGINAYFLRLGWSHGDQEIFSREEASQLFDLEGLNKAAARIDFDKMKAVNAHFIKNADDERLWSLLEPWLIEAYAPDAMQLKRAQTALPVLKARGATLEELSESFAFLFAERPLALNKKARKSIKGEGLDRLAALGDLLHKETVWTADTLQTVLEKYCADNDLSFGKVGPPLRSALTGGLPAPDLAPVMAWLGKEETLGRIQDQIDAVKAAEN